MKTLILLLLLMELPSSKFYVDYDWLDKLVLADPCDKPWLILDQIGKFNKDDESWRFRIGLEMSNRMRKRFPKHKKDIVTVFDEVNEGRIRRGDIDCNAWVSGTLYHFKYIQWTGFKNWNLPPKWFEWK